MTVQSSGEAGSRAAVLRPPAGRVVSIPGNQDARAVKDLRLGVGVIGALLPIMLIAWNWIAGDKTIVPTLVGVARGQAAQCPCFRDIWPGQAQEFRYSG
jgi:hypothetical protein